MHIEKSMSQKGQFCACGCSKYLPPGKKIIIITSRPCPHTNPTSDRMILLEEHLINFLNDKNAKVMSFTFPKVEKK